MRPAAILCALLAQFPVQLRSQAIFEQLVKNVDHVDGYGLYGGFLPSSSVLTGGRPGAAPMQRGLHGVGLEVSFSVGSAGQDSKASNTNLWEFDLAVAYSQISGFRSQDPSFDLRGSIRELPVVSWYATLHPHRWLGWYAGAHMGLLQLQNAAVYDTSGAVYPIAGSTWEVGATPVGTTIRIHDWLRFFVEGTYTLRSFPGIDWGSGPHPSTVPARFPRSLTFTGWTVAGGVEFGVTRK